MRKQAFLASGVVLSAGLSAGAVFLWTPLIFCALPLLLVVATGIVRQRPQRQSPATATAGPMPLDTEQHQLEQVAARVHCFIWHAVVRETDSIGDEPISAPKRFKWQLTFVHGHPAQALRLAGSEDEPPLARWNRARHPEDRQRGDERFVEAIRRGNHELHQEYRIIDRDGQTLWIEESLVIQPCANGSWQVAGACLDVTKHKMADLARHASEQKLRQVLQDAHCLVFTGMAEVPVDWRSRENLDPRTFHWTIDALNEKAILALVDVAITPDKASPHICLVEARVPEDRPRMSQVFIEAIRSGKTSYNQEYRVRDRHGNVQWLAETIYLRPLSANKWAYSGTTLNITQRKLAEIERQRAEAEVLAAKEEAEAANRAKDRFMAMLSHELRTPLTPVVAILSSLDADPRMPVELQQDISLMRRSVELEARLVDDLLDLTRIRHGKLHLNQRPVDGHEILRQTIGITNGAMDAKGITLRVDLLAQHATVYADPARLGQIFWNVLSNAVKFTPERGNISVDSSNNNGHLVIRISDTGKGIAPDRLEQIFDAFEQGSGESGPRQGGLGLGLTIARQLAQMHGATMTASSEGLDQGSTFTISIPSIRAEIPVAQPQPEPSPAVASSLRILFVEDDPTTRTVLARLLRKAGHVVSTAASVRDGVAQANKGEFDLLVSDIGLPDGSGLDIMRQTQKGFARGGIALSGYGTDQDIQCSLAAGFRMHITKPVDISRLYAAITEVAGVEARAGDAGR